MNNIEKGRLGEEIALKYIISKGRRSRAGLLYCLEEVKLIPRGFTGFRF